MKSNNTYKVSGTLKKAHIVIASAILVFIIGCATTEDQLAGLEGRVSADKLLPVDCLLPPQVRKLGAQVSYLTARRAIKTTALECEIRGGEYIAYNRADYRTALSVWLDKAQAGDPEAQTYTGEIYEKGLGLTPDYQTAYKWYLKAAEQGHSRAQINLGYFYEKGLGIEKDTVKALNWYRRASGVTDDIDYASTIEVKAASLAQEQTDILRQEIDRRERDIINLQRSLKENQAQLKAREQSLQDAQNTLKKLEKEIEKNKNNSARLKELQREYTTHKSLVDKAQLAFAFISTKLKQSQQKFERQAENVKRQKQKLASQQVAGPIIEVFDPIIRVTRSGEAAVRVRAGSKAQVISGKIIAPAGLQRATMNSRTLTPDSAGFFHSAVSVTSGETQVSIEAVDRLQQHATLSFNLIPTKEAVIANNDRNRVGRVAKSIDFGQYYALVIGNNEYRQFPALQTAINDAQRIAEVLTNKYGFKTRLITNADRYTILSAFNEVKGQMTEKDNLLIYYAGHGERDPETLQGYWLPIDAEQENTANWIPNSAISDLLNTVKARHIIVVADSCYSGSMTRSSVARLDTQLSDKHLKKWLKVMAKTNSRTVLTSGSIEPVLDGGGGKHSIFASAFINELENGETVIDAYRIYRRVTAQVKQKAQAIGFDQTPTYAPIQHTGHSGGEFIFVSG
ncbi:MAG: hypothetical protein GXP08_02710 [Gammaproteobacteria bacterium]|nr:hypothetical protein [Gammaproteobacteria bacterium]